jgi:hypothetical protein
MPWIIRVFSMLGVLAVGTLPYSSVVSVVAVLVMKHVVM